MAILAPARQRLARWFPLGGYSDPIRRYRAFSTYVIAVLFLIFSPPFYIAVGLAVLSATPPNIPGLIGLVVSASIVYALALGAVVFTRVKRQTLGAILLLILLAVTIGLGIALNGFRADGLTIFLVLSMWMALSITTLLVGIRGVLPMSALIVIGILRLAFVIETTSGLRAAFFIILLAGLVQQLGLTWLQARGQNDAVQRLSLDAAQRLTTYEVIYRLTQRVTQRPDLNTLMADIVRLVRDSSVEIEAVQLWLVMDDRRNVVLSASTDRADPIGRQVGIGSLDIVGRVALDGKMVLVQNTPSEQSYRRSALPAGIQSQLAVPIKIVSVVTGVVLVTSRQNDSFLGADAQSLEKLADQAANAIESTRLFASVQNGQNENRRLNDELRASQKSVERLNRQLTGQAWTDYLRGRDKPLEYTIDMKSGQVDNFSEWTDGLKQAQQSNAVTIQAPASQTEKGHILALPISIRGQAIGALEFELESDQMPSPEQIAVMQQVVERMGLSAENARLFDEAQRLVRRETMLGVISARLQSAASIDSVLMAAAQSLSESLNASRVAIRLADPDTNPDFPPVDRSPNQEAAR